MNISTTPRRWALAVATFVCMVVAQNAYGQCGDFVTEPAPGTVNITLNLTAMNGTEVNLDATVMLAYGFVIDPACTYEISPLADFSAGVVALPYMFDCSDVGAAQTWYVRVNGPAGPSTPLNFRQLSITINDNITPLIDAPANQGPFANDVGQCYYSGGVPGAVMTQIVWPLIPTAIVVAGEYGDNCAANLSYTLSGATIQVTPVGGDASGVTFNVGITTVTYTVTDNDGNSATDQFTVTVVDAELPVIVCPGNQIRSTDPGTCSYVAVGTEFDPVSFSDNCPGPYTLEYRLNGGAWVTATTLAGVAFTGPTPGPNVTTVEWRITDVAGNSFVCGPSFTVTVNDNENPNAGCIINPLTLTFDYTFNTSADGTGNCSVFLFFNTAPTDNCSISSNSWAITGATVDAGAGCCGTSTFFEGFSLITFTVTDGSGNMNTCTYGITVIDDEKPIISCAAISPPGPIDFNECNPFVYPQCKDACFTVNVAPGSCGQTVSWYRPSPLTHLFTDNCGILTITEEQPIMPDGLPYPLSSFLPPLSSNDFFVDNGVTPYPYNVSNPLHWVTPVTAQFPVGTTELRYYVYDINGNYDSITVSITVLETQPPVATCQPTLIVPVDPFGSATITAAMVNNGSTDNCGIDNMMVSPTSFTCSAVGAGPQTVTLTVEDFAGNTATCTTSVTVTDNQAPVVNCPNDIVTSTGAGTCNTTAGAISGLSLTMIASNMPLTGAGQYKDNCSVTAITYQLTGATTGGPAAYPIPGGTVFNKGVTFVTYTFTDAQGNSTACSFDVSVEDQVAPTTANCPNPAPVNANIGGCIAIVNWTAPTFTDNCPPTTVPAGSITTTHTPGSFFFFGTTQVTYTATDAAGNVGYCTFNVTVNDTQNPVANCQDITVGLGAGGTVTVLPAQVDNGSTDNCFYNYVNLPVTYDCTDMGPNFYTLNIVDGAGNPGAETCTVTVVDPLAPVITNCAAHTPLPVSLDANCQGSLNAAVYFSSNFTVTDNTQLAGFCPLNFTVDVDGQGFVSVYNWTCLDAGPNTVTFKVTDVFGNMGLCTKTITVNDVTPPIIINFPPTPLFIECDVYNPFDFLTLGQITSADVADACDDACGIPLVPSFFDIFFPGACANAFSIARVWSVFDQAGNQTQFVQTFFIQDTEAPTFNVPITTFNLVANDQDDIFPCVAPFTVGLTNSGVLDNCTPSLLSFFDVFYQVDFPASPITPFIPGTSVTEDFPIGTSLVIFTVFDPCGNSNQITFTVNVTDENGPIISEPFGDFFPFFNTATICGQTFTIPNVPGNCGNNFSWYRPSFAGLDFLDCKPFCVDEFINDPDVQSAVSTSTPFNYNSIANVHPTVFFPVGETTVTYVVTDDADGDFLCDDNVTNTCFFTVKVLDTQAPSITCPGNQTLSISSGCVGITTVPNYLNGVAVTDNCPNGVTLAQTPVAGTLLSAAGLMPPGPVQAGQTFTVTVVATDNEPNNLSSAPCSFTVTLFDGNAPVPDLPILPVITSFCGKDTVDAPSATDCNGTMFVTIYGTPSVSVIGILPPLVPGGPPRYIIPAGNYAITWSYTDPQNNTTTQLQSVNIFVDVFPPTANCKPPFTVFLNAAGQYLLSTSELNNGSFDQDGCGPVTLSLNPSILTCANVNQTNTPVNVGLIVKDVNNNIAQCITQVTVKDITVPVLSPIPSNITVQACSNIPAAATITAVDVCDANVTVTLVEVSTKGANDANCNFYTYTITRTWTATDDSGNSSTGSQVITVQDTQAPVFDANTPVMIMVVTDLDRLTCDDTVTLNVLNYLSDCAPDNRLTVTNSLNGLGANFTGIYAVGTYNVTFTAVDPCGNVSSKLIQIVVKDGTSPTAVCINGISVSLQPSGTVVIGTTQVNDNSFDNCPDPLFLQVQRLDPLGAAGSFINFNCADADGVTQHPVKLIVKDVAGNESTCETFVVVQDNVNPTITFCPPNVTVACTADMSPAALGSATATDNCPIAAPTFSDVITNGTGSICQVKTRTWTASDLAGNTATCVQIISIQDLIKPVFNLLPANVTISCSDALAAPPVVGAIDNCDANVSVVLVLDTINIAPGNCGMFSFTQVRTWTATDDCGNTNVHTQQVTVTDVEKPQFLGMPDTIIVKSADFPPNLSCTVPIALNIDQYLTDCSPDNLITLVHNAPFGAGGTNISGNYTVGNYTVIFTATDACNNVNKDTIVIMVMDNSTPNLSCGDLTVPLGTNGMASIMPEDVDPNSSDNCGIDTMYLSQSEFDCSDLGANQVTLTAVDAAGNSNACTVTVNVTFGTNAGFTLTAVGSPESYFGADDGSAVATATGGSGMFTYEWDNGAMTASINGLSAGIYTITVMDTVSGCLQIDTAIVGAGAKITVSVGDASGCQGQTVSVPVSVDNFNDVTDFSFTVHPNVATVGTIVGITSGSVNAMLAAGFSSNVTSNNLGAFWFGGPLTFPNGTVLFNVDILLGAAIVGSTSPLIVTNTPVNLQFMQDSSGVDVVVGMVAVEDGLLEITCTVPDLEIGGDLQTWKAPTKPIPGANVALTGTITGNQTTGAPGTYLFPITTGANTTVTPNKTAVAKSSLAINVGDLATIQAHAAPPPVQIPLTNPYALVAGDINGDKAVNLIDYTIVLDYIVNNLVTDGHFTYGNPVVTAPDWKFIPKSYTFPAPNPLNPAPPSAISHTNVTADFLDDDFVGVLMGDVTGNVIPTFTGDDDMESSNVFKFRLDERMVQAGELVTIPFKASDFSNRQAYQMTIAFDPSVFELQNIQPGVLPGLGNANFGTLYLGDGLLSTAWAATEPMTFADNEVLFTLTFKALSNSATLASALHVSSEVAEAMAMDANGNMTPVDFEYMTSTGTGEAETQSFALYQNQPNPFNDLTTIGFRLPETSRATLRVFNASGQLVKTVVGSFAKGYNEWNFRRAEFGAPGVYYYELETAKNSDRKKMILID